MFEHDGRLFRCIRSQARGDFEAVEKTGLLEEWQRSGRLVAYERVKPDTASQAPVNPGDLVIALDRVRTITYPYEWPFEALKDAAITHLDMLHEALERGVTATDASAYNIQFDATAPVFIDQLSWRPYRDGEIWSAHRQFCEQFLHPLVLQAYGGIAFNAWYRGEQEGIRGLDVVKVIPIWRKLQPRTFMQIVLPAKFDKAAQRRKGKTMGNLTADPNLPKPAFRHMLGSLRSWISGLAQQPGGAGVWLDYTDNTSYSERGADAKAAFVSRAVARFGPQLVWDMGCNTGQYAEIALANGADQVVGFESDPGTADLAFKKAKQSKTQFLPLVQNLTNPSPAQGWRQRERDGLAERRRPDTVLALALIHHLRFRANIPLAEIVTWLVELAPTGVIEFVPKSDPMCQRLLGNREDLFDDYEVETFVNMLTTKAALVERETLPDSQRVLVSFGTHEP